MPASCPATPATLNVTADSYSDSTSKTVGGAAARHRLLGAPVHAVAERPRADIEDATDGDGVQITTDVTQPASPAQATPKTVALALPAAVLTPNAHAVLSGGVLCANPASGTCKTIGTATAAAPLYPVALTGSDYLTGER